MNNLLVDTNVLIRLLVKDDPGKFETIVKLVEKVEKNELTLVIPTVTLAECCWLLKSYYKLEKKLISEYLIDILQSENVEAEEDIVIDALILYAEKNVDFADALISCKTNHSVDVLTWDKKDFKKLNCEFYTPEELL
ncbi:MAG: type II toxin-antitoxin system VapC family toxin [Bacillus sp. (in: Bacteria)]|nr:type II toxin-antitoxin system VapC family toxin [Bacillus sp. (in: firmicutes)]